MELGVSHFSGVELDRRKDTIDNGLVFRRRSDSEITQEMLYLLRKSDCHPGDKCVVQKGAFTRDGGPD
jgi:hypothetical protein